MDTREVYEKKIYDEDLPAQLSCEQRNEEGLYFWPHWHEEIEILYVTEGSARITLEQQEHLLEKGSMIIVNSNELHSGYCESTPYVCKALSLNPQNLITDATSQNILFQPLVIRDKQVDAFIDAIFRECEERLFAYKDNCRALLTQFLVYLSRNYMLNVSSDKISEKRKRNLERLNQVLCYIDEHSAEYISNKELAKMMYLSEDRFGHLFRKNVGIPPQQYINEIRLQKAKELIQSTSHTITEIARMVGFQDYNNFGRQFQRHYGCTPREAQKSGVLTKNPKAKKR